MKLILRDIVKNFEKKEVLKGSHFVGKSSSLGFVISRNDWICRKIHQAL